MAIGVLTNMNFRGRESACFLLIRQTIVLFSLILVSLSFIITVNGQGGCNPDPENPSATCDRSFNYTTGSTFESNLDKVVDSLAQAANQTGFKISVIGGIYGLFQCRADLTVDQCYTCWQLAKSTIQQGCETAGGATTWPFHCFLRYEYYNFTGKLQSSDRSGCGESSSDVGVFLPNDFNSVAENLLKNLTAEAARETKRSAFGSSQTIYGLVQCTRDLSARDCTTCLSNAINSIFISNPRYVGYQYWGQNCIFRYQIYPFFNLNMLPATPAEGPPNQITPSSSKSGQTKSTNETPIILGVVGGLVLLLIICAFATGRRLKSAICRWGSQDHDEESTLLNHDGQMVFTMEELRTATKNFHDDNKLGEGGFGPVYKGITQNGKEIAVKKLSLKSMQGRKEFLNEVKIVAKIQHRNLVNLLGCCAEGSERLLVYEYLPNKSLDKILFDPNDRKNLDWQKRYNIIMGVARGLLYLHQDSHLRIIHRDIKASNVLLDEKLNPKIADFGLARLFPEDESHVNTRVAGTYGYMPPEYAMQGQLSAKTDIYSFGVLLLEVIAGRKNADYNLSHEMQILLEWVWRSYDGGNIVQIIDPAITETCDEKEAWRCIKLLLCHPLTLLWLLHLTPMLQLPNWCPDHDEESTLLNHDGQIVFTMEALRTATENFDDDNKLGEGGFGPVYKGTTQNGKEIAVKKLSLKSMQGRKEFLNEVKLVAKIQHRNLVNLLGCCAEGSERLLVYEYLPNKSLDTILFDPNERRKLDWQKRYNIIMGVARGLLYLHQDSQLWIIHRDIKASNVLLDEKLNPKIADFGLARLFPEDESHVSTRVAGTYGYMPPEYAMQGQLSVKTDVYSFGILILELIAGRKNTDYNLPPEMQILLGWVWRSYDGGNIVQLIDPAIIKTCDEKEAWRCIQVGLLCTQAEAHLHPLMSTVSLMLSTHYVTSLPDPTKPGFVSSYLSQTAKVTSSGLSHASATTSSPELSEYTPLAPASNATASITDLVPR